MRMHSTKRVYECFLLWGKDIHEKCSHIPGAEVLMDDTEEYCGCPEGSRLAYREEWNDHHDPENFMCK